MGVPVGGKESRSGMVAGPTSVLTVMSVGTASGILVAVCRERGGGKYCCASTRGVALR